VKKSELVRSRGRLVADTLAGSWRTSPPPLDLSSADLDAITPLLYNSGAAALGWRRICHTELSTTESGRVLHQGYRLQALQFAMLQDKIAIVHQLLNEACIDAILVKGWAVAGFYPELLLRPLGDIDLVVRPRDYKAANEVLARPEARGCWVDLHNGLPKLDDRSLDELFSRSHVASLRDAQIRVLSLEDHLALLAVHLLKHGAWRPLWLCDIALILESTPDDFDWDLCLGKNKRQVNWILSAIGLAHSLLGAKISHAGIAGRAKQIPSWLMRSVVKEWETPFAINQPPMCHRAPMITYLGNPRGLLQDLKNRWPNPILATVSINGKFNALPRLPYQLGNCFVRTAQFVFPGAKQEQ
jgi:hypothetical protein